MVRVVRICSLQPRTRAARPLHDGNAFCFRRAAFDRPRGDNHNCEDDKGRATPRGMPSQNGSIANRRSLEQEHIDDAWDIFRLVPRPLGATKGPFRERSGRVDQPRPNRMRESSRTSDKLSHAWPCSQQRND
jgi:hypothetical protein